MVDPKKQMPVKTQIILSGLTPVRAYIYFFQIRNLVPGKIHFWTIACLLCCGLIFNGTGFSSDSL